MRIFRILAVIVICVVARAQNDQSGFISIDCGLPANTSYVDQATGVLYTSDVGFIDSGESKLVSPDFQTSYVERPLWTVRSFPQGTRNCYTLKPPGGKGNRYLIRATFFHGSYDGSNSGTKYAFELHLGPELWETIAEIADVEFWKEIIHTLSSDYVNVCLVKTGASVPFISVLELRPFDNTAYPQSNSLRVVKRSNFDSLPVTVSWIRYKDDIYDREWFADRYDVNSTLPATLFTTSTMNNTKNSCQVPSLVMSTARLANGGSWLNFSLTVEGEFDLYYIYLHFAELQELQSNQSRKFNIYINKDLWFGPYSPSYLTTDTVYKTGYTSVDSMTFMLGLFQTNDSTEPPAINAAEVFVIKRFSLPETYFEDVAAISSIKTAYGLSKNWQGDPCSPEAFVWQGISCTSDVVLRIISLNLTSNKLEGAIAPAVSNLSVLEILDLSYNNLSGEVPAFLGLLSSLKVLNLKGNKFTGTIPASLLEKSRTGKLSLSFDEENRTGTDEIINNSGTSNTTNVVNDEKKNKLKIPIVGSVVAGVFFVFLALLITLCVRRWRTKSVVSNVMENKDQLLAVKVEQEEIEIERKNNFVVQAKKWEFVYGELVTITNNFEKLLGEGGFGKVYYGCIGKSEVAVKILSDSSQQGYKEFQAEATLLMNIHHKNLTALVGYCYEEPDMGIIYEYMANGTLDKHIFSNITGNGHVLSWTERLHMAIDAAQGLEYLHHGCKPPIIHRDIKTTNILLDENFQAKLADFGLSRCFPIGGATHVTTIVAGSLGYLDPESLATGRITEKSDVYSFGVVLLEIITGRSAITKNSDEPHIVSWVSSELKTGNITNIVNEGIQNDAFSVNSGWKYLELAMACVARNSSRRPTMNYVAAELQECLNMVNKNAMHEHGDNSIAPQSSTSRVLSMGQSDTEIFPLPR